LQLEVVMSLAVHIELTNEAPWANEWIEYYAVFTNTGNEHQEPFDGQHKFFRSDGTELSRGGLGGSDGLAPGEQFTTDRFNLPPTDAGEHKLVIEAWVDGNVTASGEHTFTVQ
jgi:hypothetical protein